MFSKMLKAVKAKIEARRAARRLIRNLRDRALHSSRAPLNEYARQRYQKHYDRVNKVCLMLFTILTCAAVLAILAQLTIEMGA